MADLHGRCNTQTGIGNTDSNPLPNLLGMAGRRHNLVIETPPPTPAIPKTMKHPLAIVVFSAVVPCHAAPSLMPVSEVKGFSSPESAAWDGTHYFVSNVGKELKPTEKDGDGFISRMDAKGENLKFDFITGLNAPKGLLVVGNTLYACDIDVLLGFDLKSGKKNFEVSFAADGVRFLNDICAAGDGRAMVSATDKNTVYLVDLREKSAKPLKFDHPPKGPNGLAFMVADVAGQEQGDPYLLVAEWGADGNPDGNLRLYGLDAALTNAQEEEKPEDFPVKNGYLDGVAVITRDGSPETLLYSDWVGFKPGGKLLLCNPEEKNSLTELEIPWGPVAGPADFLYEDKAGSLVLPSMMDGRVLILKLKK